MKPAMKTNNGKWLVRMIAVAVCLHLSALSSQFATCSAQNMSIGVKGGINLQDLSFDDAFFGVGLFLGVILLLLLLDEFVVYVKVAKRTWFRLATRLFWASHALIIAFYGRCFP